MEKRKGEISRPFVGKKNGRKTAEIYRNLEAIISTYLYLRLLRMFIFGRFGSWREDWKVSKANKYLRLFFMNGMHKVDTTNA